jgi:hypothetical protein
MEEKSARDERGESKKRVYKTREGILVKKVCQSTRHGKGVRDQRCDKYHFKSVKEVVKAVPVVTQDLRTHFVPVEANSPPSS